MILRLVEVRQEPLLRLDGLPRAHVLAVAGFCNDVTIDEDDLAAEDDTLDAAGDAEACTQDYTSLTPAMLGAKTIKYQAISAYKLLITNSYHPLSSP